MGKTSLRILKPLGYLIKVQKRTKTGLLDISTMHSRKLMNAAADKLIRKN